MRPHRSISQLAESSALKVVLFLLLSLYVSVIADLNRPNSGNIRESQDAMLMLQASLKAQPPAAFDRYRPGAAQ